MSFFSHDRIVILIKVLSTEDFDNIFLIILIGHENLPLTKLIVLGRKVITKIILTYMY